MLPAIEYTVFNPRKGKQIRQENIDSNLYPLSFIGCKHQPKAENVNDEELDDLKLRNQEIEAIVVCLKALTVSWPCKTI